MNKTRGFTLVELIMTVLIIAVLAAIALPQYQEYVRKGKRSAVMASMLEAAHQLERYYSANGTYLDPATGLLSSVYTTTSGSAVSPDYNIGALAFTQNTFTLQAAPVGSMVGDRCGNFQVDQAGNQNAVNYGSNFATQADANAYCLRQ